MTLVEDRPTIVQDRPTEPVPTRPVPAGWGSHEERRLVLWGVLGFLLLGLYAAGFVLIGSLAWS